jgi:DNA-binding transcriptional ArsR family regulator
MRSEAPALLPIFRSTHQADLLTLLLLHPDTDYTATELADRLHVPLTTLHREIARLEQAGLITSRPVGRSRLLRADTTSRVTGPLTDLLLVTFGPQPVIAEEFGDLAADVILIFGSWAARYHGDPGPPPHDIDVLLVGDLDRDGAYDAAARAEQRLGFPVNPTIISTRRWHAADDPLVRTITASPTLTVTDRQKPA